MTPGNDDSTPPSDRDGPNGPPLGSTPASDSFARETVLPMMNALAAVAEKKALATTDFVDALINTQAAVLGSILGPKATGDLLQAQGRQIAETAATPSAVSITDTVGSA